MRFGSVEFFKVLIKTVLAIVFFVPLALAIVFGILWARQSSETDRLTEENAAIVQDNDKLTVIADVLIGEKAGRTEDIREIMKRSGVSYDDLIAYLITENELDARGLYDALSKAGVSDKDIIMMAASKNTVNAEGFFEVMSKNGIAAEDMVKTALKNGRFTAEDYYALFKNSGMKDDEIMALLTGSNAAASSSGGETSTVPAPVIPDEESPYADLYPDMYVPAPQEYVYEEGTIYFTFDDGPSSNTYMLLDYLKSNNVKATWFVVPDGSEWSNERIKAIADAGHVVGVHSRTHVYTEIYASVEAYLKDFYEAWSIIREVTGKTPQIFRFAGGSNNDFNVDTREAIIKEMTRRGFRFYDWNVDSGDVAGATWQDMYNSIPRDCRNSRRPIVLMHDSKSTYNTVLVLDDVLKVLLGEGCKFDVINDDTEPVQFVGPFS